MCTSIIRLASDRIYLFGTLVAAAISVAVAVAPSTARADAPRVLPAGQLPDDSRLGPLKDLNGYFPFTVSPSPEAWHDRAEKVRRQLLVATGLWPTPTKTPLNAKIYGRVDRDGYTVEKVTLESYPGFFVTGNLYRPKGKSGKLPGVLSPHGHFANGRFYEAQIKSSASNSSRGRSDSTSAGVIPIRPAASRSPAWGASRSSGTWSDMPIASRSARTSRIITRSSAPRWKRRPAGVFIAHKPRCSFRQSWACKRTTRSACSIGSANCPTLTRSGSA